MKPWLQHGAPTRAKTLRLMPFVRNAHQFIEYDEFFSPK